MKNESAGQWYSTEIYFGRHFSSRGEITEQQFAGFLSNHITPAFPAGMTVYDAYGQMQHSSGKIEHQKTKVVVLVHKNSEDDDKTIKQIIAAYRSQFGNPQVMMLTKPVKPEFWGD